MVPFVILTAWFKAMKFKAIRSDPAKPNQILLATSAEGVMKDKIQLLFAGFEGMTFLPLRSKW
jgi:hypothetical protein